MRSLRDIAIVVCFWLLYGACGSCAGSQQPSPVEPAPAPTPAPGPSGAGCEAVCANAEDHHLRLRLGSLKHQRDPSAPGTCLELCTLYRDQWDLSCMATQTTDDGIDACLR